MKPWTIRGWRLPSSCNGPSRPKSTSAISPGRLSARRTVIAEAVPKSHHFRANRYKLLLGNRQTLASQQFVHLAQQQVVFVQPGSNLLASQLQPLLWFAAGDSHTRPAHMLPDHLGLSFVGPRRFLPDSLFLRETHDPPYGVPVRTGQSCYSSNLLPGQPPPDDLIKVHPPHLPVCHLPVLLENWLAHLLVQPQSG